MERVEDVFYLECSEIWAPPADLAERVARRRLFREQQKRLAPPPFIPPLSHPAWGSDLQWKMFSSALGAVVLQRGVQERNGRRLLVGTPGSPGRARHGARSLDQTTSTASSRAMCSLPIPRRRSRTPLFNIASAAVTEVGGPFRMQRLWHASSVSRW
jgi:hypothetical protein